MKKPNPIRQTNLLGYFQVAIKEIKRLYKGFVDSAYYRKVMTDPGYLREQAIFDFLTGQGYDLATANNWTELIRKNYYRAF